MSIHLIFQNFFIIKKILLKFRALLGDCGIRHARPEVNFLGAKVVPFNILGLKRECIASHINYSHCSF